MLSSSISPSRVQRRLLGLVAVIACVSGLRLSASELVNPEPVTKMYLEITGVTGDVTDPGFEGQIEVLSYSWDGANPGAGGSAWSEPGEISLIKYIDSSSPSLFVLVAAGIPLKEARLTVVQTVSGTIDSLKLIDMRDVLVTSVQSEGGTEAVTLSFDRSKITYKNGGVVAADPVTKIYLDIKEIPGDVTDRGFEGQIEVISYSWDAPNVDVAGTGPGGAGEISVIKYIDSSSPLLLLNATSGTQLKAATLKVVETVNGAIDSIRIIDMRDVTITAVVTASETQRVSLNFAWSKVTQSNDPNGF